MKTPTPPPSPGLDGFDSDDEDEEEEEIDGDVGDNDSKADEYAEEDSVDEGNERVVVTSSQTMETHSGSNKSPRDPQEENERESTAAVGTVITPTEVHGMGKGLFGVIPGLGHVAGCTEQSSEALYRENEEEEGGDVVSTLAAARRPGLTSVTDPSLLCIDEAYVALFVDTPPRQQDNDLQPPRQNSTMLQQGAGEVVVPTVAMETQNSAPTPSQSVVASSVLGARTLSQVSVDISSFMLQGQRAMDRIMPSLTDHERAMEAMRASGFFQSNMEDSVKHLLEREAELTKTLREAQQDNASMDVELAVERERRACEATQVDALCWSVLALCNALGLAGDPFANASIDDIVPRLQLAASECDFIRAGDAMRLDACAAATSHLALTFLSHCGADPFGVLAPLRQSVPSLNDVKPHFRKAFQEVGDLLPAWRAHGPGLMLKLLADACAREVARHQPEARGSAGSSGSGPPHEV